MSRSGTSETIRRTLGVVLALSPAFAYLGVIAAHAANIPRGDDYPAILQFLADWTQSSGLSATLGLLWEQFFSHRIVLTRLAAVADLALLGHCDLRVLQALGWLGWLGLAAGLAWSTPSARAQPWRALPVFLLLMHPQGYTNLHIAMQAVQNIGVVALAFAAIVTALSVSTVGFGASVVLAVAATLASVNGLLVFPALVVAFLIQGNRMRAAIVAGIGAAVWLAFFFGFTREGRPFVVGEFLHNATAMTGGFLQFERLPLRFVSVVGGLLLVTSGAVLAFPAVWRRWPVQAAFLLFLGLTIAMAAAGRIGWGADYMLQDRYRLYGLLMAATLLTLALDAELVARRPAVFGAATAAAAACCALSYIVTLPSLLSAARWAEATAMNHQLGVHFPITSSVAWQSSFTALQRAQFGGVFRMPVRFSHADINQLVDTLSKKNDAMATDTSFRSEANGGIDGVLLTPAKGKLMQPDFATLRLENTTLLLPVERWRAPVSEIVRHASVLREDFALVLPGALYAAGRFRVHGFRRDASGRLNPIWEGTAECPPLPLAAKRTP